jgi:ribosome-binding ATPase YchF (GTP1/OBG family)
MHGEFTGSADEQNVEQKKTVMCDIHGTLIIKNDNGKAIINQPLVDLLKEIKEQHNGEVILISAAANEAREQLAELGFDFEALPILMNKGDDEVTSAKRSAVLGFEDDDLQLRMYKILGVKAFHPDQLNEAKEYVKSWSDSPKGLCPKEP